MNERVWIAQADTTPVQNPAPLKVVTVVKPGSEQAITIDLGFDQKTKVDLSAVANEKMTMVHVGTKLIVLFDNHSTVTIEPFFDSTGKPLANLDVNLGAGHDVTGDQFASLFPITEDQSVLPAAGGGGSPASGADFHNPTVDPLAIGNPLPLLGPEELGNFQVNLPLGPQSNFIDTAPDITLTPADVDLNGHNIVDEAGIVAHIGQPAGTAAGNGSAVAHGTFALSDVDGLADIKSLTINGTVIAIADLVTATTATPIVGSNGHGTLVITDYDPTTGIGHYTYTLNTSVTESPAQNNGTDTVANGDSFTIVVTDNSNIASNPATLLVDIKDDVPSITVSQSVPTLTVDESFLPNGTTPDPGLGHTVDTADFSSAFTVVEGADGGTVSYALTLVSGSSNLIDTATGQAVVLTESGNTISGYVTGHVGDSSYLVFTLSVDAASGSATLTQDRAVHELDTSNNNEGISLDSNLVTLTVTATDGDGDVTSKTLDLGSSVTFQDDGPVLLANASTTATVDEDNIHDLLTHGSSPDFFGGTDLLGAAYTTGSLSGLVNFGADGKGSFSFVTGAERTSALASLNALGLTSHGEALTFSISNLTGDLIATTGSGFNTHVVLDLHLSSNGSYIVQLFDAIDHDTPPANTADENTTLQEHGQNTQVDSIDFGQIIQATDGDGDHVTLDGAFNVRVIDDVPHVSLSTNPIVYVGIDESAGSQDGFLGLPPNDTTSSSVRNIFATFEATHAGTDLGNDTDIAHAVAGSPAIAYAHGAGPLVIPNIAGGADGVSSIVYSLQVSSTGVYSGVQTTDGHNIYLYEDAATGLIVGRVGGTDPAHNDANANGTIAFAIAIESDGDIDIAQYLSLKEFDTSKNNETVSLADGAIQAKVIVTDGDGDTASDTTNIGSHILFYDDGPSVSVAAVSDANVVITTYDILGGSDSSTALFGSLFTATPTYGADGEGSGPAWSYSLNINGFGNHVNSGLTAIVGGKIYLAELSDGTIVGYTGSQAPHSIDSSVVFSISVDGNGTVTLTQYAAINHGSGDLASLADSLIQLTASANVTDGDGDGGSGSKTINIGANLHFQDTMPSAGSNNTVKLDDETAVHIYATQNAGGTGDVPASNTTGTLAHTFGADGAGSVLLQSATLPANEGFTQVVTNGGKTLTIYQEQNGHTVAVVQVSLTDSTSGNYTVTELNPIFQPTHSTTEDNVQFTVNYQVTDGDSDAAPGSFLISVNDDTPTLGAIESITVSDNAIHTGTIAFSAGADGVGTGVLSGTPPANLTSGGQAVHYWVSADGHTLIGYTGSAPSGSDQPDPSHQVFVLTLNANDQGYSYQQIQEFDNAHTTTDFIGNSNFSYPNAPNGEVDVTYSGGTIAKVTGSGNVNGSSTGWGIGSDTFTGADHLHFDFKQSDTGTATSSVTYSFHKDGSVDYVVHYSDGTSDTVSGYAATKDGTLTLTAPTGATIDSVDFTGNAGTPNGGFKIVLDGADVDTTTTSPTSDLGFHVALTDGDGDAVGGDFTVTAQNNTPPTIDVHPTDPTNPLDAHNLVNEAGLPVIGSDANADSETTHGTIHLFDADGTSTIQSLTVTLGGSSQQVNIADITGSTGHTFDFTSGNAHGTLTITNYDSSTGDADYTYTLTKPVDETTANNGADIITDGDTFTLTVTDGSGATGNATLDIDIKDDIPSSPALQTATVQAGDAAGHFNVAFVLDFSQSISNSDFTTMLAAVKEAGDKLFANGGQGAVTVVDFAEGAHTVGTFTTQSAFDNAMAAVVRGNDIRGTDYTDGVNQLMNHSSFDPTQPNSQVFFVSDGAPNEDLGTGGASLSDSTAAAWQSYVTDNHIHVEVFGVGDAINSNNNQLKLEQIDVDGHTDYHDVTGFDSLADQLTASANGGNVTGNILHNVDSSIIYADFGADGPGNGGGIQSITVTTAADGPVTFTYNAATNTIVGGNSFDQQGNSTLSVDTEYGHLSFNFATGDYSFSAANTTTGHTEVIGYTVVDGDGDTATGEIDINIVPPPPSLTVSDTSATEGSSEIFTINLSHAASGPVDVTLLLTNGTAGNTDYDTNANHLLVNYNDGNGFVAVGAGGVIHIPTGTTSIEVSVGTTNDSLVESNENFTLTATVTSGNTTNTSSTGTATIVDNDHAPTIDADNLSVVSNYGANLFTVTDAAFLHYASDADGNTLTITDASGSVFTNLSHSGSAITIDDNDTSNSPPDTFTFTVSDGFNPITSDPVTYRQDTSGAIDGTNNDDIIVAAAIQQTTIGFNSGGYDVGDVVSLTVDGHTYSYTVESGHTSAEQVYDALKSVSVNGVTLAHSLDADGVSWANNLTSNAVTLTGAPDADFSVTSGITNVAQLHTYAIDFKDNISGFSNSSTETIKLVIDGVTYSSDGTHGGFSDNSRFDNTANDLLGKIESSIASVTTDSWYDTTNNTFHIYSTSALSITSATSTASNDTSGDIGSDQTLNSTQPAPSVTTTDGATLNGNGGDDYLIGSHGSDTLTGGTGNDQLYGGDGSDIFKWQSGDLASGSVDTILDFQTGTGSGDHDTLDLSALLSGYSASQAASHVRFQYDDGQSSLASAGSPHSDNGDVTVQVNLSGNTWTNVAVLHDTGANLTSGSDAIQMILNSTQGVQTYHV